LTSDSNVFVFSMDKDGTPRWLKEVPISSTGNSLGIIFGAYDAEGNWVLPVPPDTSFSGVSLGIINKGDKIFVPMGCPGIATRFAVAAAILDADGNEVWCDYLLGAGGRFLPAGTHLDASGTLIVTGELESERASGEEEPSDVQHVWSLELSNDEASTTAGYLHLPRDAWVSLNSSALDPEGFLYFAGNSGNRGWLACMKYTQ
jgi:hypothetical protein